MRIYVQMINNKYIKNAWNDEESIGRKGKWQAKKYSTDGMHRVINMCRLNRNV